MKLICVKLVTGEEIIARLGPEVLEKDDYINVEKPRRLVIAQTGPNQMGLQMIPWIIIDPNGTYPIHTSHIVTPVYNIPSDVEKSYIQQTSDLVIA